MATDQADGSEGFVVEGDVEVWTEPARDPLPGTPGLVILTATATAKDGTPTALVLAFREPKLATEVATALATAAAAEIAKALAELGETAPE